jgi:RNA polymerase sigma factor (sigma-70 family)
MTAAPSDNQDALAEARILEFARGQLGPRSERCLREPGALDAVRSQIEAGAELADAVLGHVHSRLKQDPRLADEFAAHFVFDLMLMGRISMASSSRLRRFLDTGDLVLSVFGDVWADFGDVAFKSRNQYKKLFAQRLDWKAADQVRRMTASTRREDLRSPQQPDELHGTPDDPLRDAIRKEEREQLILLLLRLKDRDRRLVSLHLKGEPLEAIAASEGLTPESARKALARAIEQARQLADFQARATATGPA